MIIPFKETPETRKGFPCTAFRWAFQIHWDFIGFGHQHQIDGKWYGSHTMVYAIYVMKDWRVGFDHFWYDGPHCQFCFGPLRFQWHNDTCKKCIGE